MFASATQGGHKKQDAQKKRSSHTVHEISPEAGRKSIVGKTCGRARFCTGSERVKELWMVRVVS